MSTATNEQIIVNKPSMGKKNLPWVILLGIMLVAGVYGVTMSLLHGESAWGVSDAVPWGLLLPVYVFFVVSSTGLCLVSSLGHVFNIDKFKTLGIRALLLAIIALVVGFMVIAVELGHPFRLLIYAVISPNFTSPIWWMGALYSLYLVFIGFELWYLIKDNHSKSRLFGILGFSSAIIAHSNLGAVFGMLVARPYWTGPYMPIYFILSALVSGAAILIIVFYLIHKSGKEDHSQLIKDLGKLLTLFMGITIFFTSWKILTGVYGQVPGKYEAIMSLLNGPLSINFWTFEVAIGMLIPIIILSFYSTNIKNIFTAAVLAVLGIFFMRYHLVVAGQIVELEVIKGVTSGYNLYVPTFVEIAVVLGSLALVPVLYFLGMNYITKLQQNK